MKKIVPFFLLIYACSVQNVDKVYYNGIIWTGEPNNASATALVVNGEEILFVGEDSEALSMATANTEKIDLLGHFVTPGFIDNHVHFMSGGFQLSSVNLRDVNNKAEFQERIASHAETLPPGIWMQGGDWDHELWGGSYPDKSWIDDVAPDRHVYLGRHDGHMALANSKALELAGITSSTTDPVGGIVIKDGNGNPTCILKDEAMDLVNKVIPDPTIDELDQALDAAMDYALSLGITQVHDMGTWQSLETVSYTHLTLPTIYSV